MRRLLLASLSLMFLLLSVAAGFAQIAPASADKPYVIEYYYKAKWGYQDEFFALFKKNHYPVLRRQIEMGRIREVKMEAPVYHMTEDARWDFRVTIVFKDAATAVMPFDEDALKRQLFPDQAAYQKEEQRRFEILLQHWDLPIKVVPLETK